MTAWSFLAAATLAAAPPAPAPIPAVAGATVVRDGYGVPAIVADSDARAMAALGAAVAADRLWQMELSRRAALGRLAEVLGPDAVPADSEVLRTSPTEADLMAQIEALPPRIRRLWEAYAEGVNATIRARRAAGTLPEGYARHGFEPAPWTTVDSAAIAVRLAAQFGSGGAGELRNLAALLYLRSQPVRNRALDAFDDLAWANDPASPTTVDPVDDPHRADPPRIFPQPDRRVTEAHLGLLPPANLLELAPAVRLSERAESTRLAQALNIPYKTGSYAVVVGPGRSRTGRPLLLGAPQMGHGAPSPVYEFAFRTPTTTFAGMGVPGVPAPIIGATPAHAWTLTSGVADVADVFVNRREGDSYLYGEARRPLVRVPRTLSVKGEPDRMVVQLRTRYGPVLLDSRSGGAVYSVARGYAGRELESFAALWDLVRARRPRDLDAIHPRIAVTFNLFFAFGTGEIGWRYCGATPIRADGVDPRLPTPGEPRFDWRGFVPAARMPRVDNPRGGVIANWNNKPAAWWDNGDTPAWGRRFRVSNLVDALPVGPLGVTDLELAAQRIAWSDEETQTAWLDDLRRALDGADLRGPAALAAPHLRAWDGWMRDGSQGAVLYQEAWRTLRRQLFEPRFGAFLGQGTFETVVQPTLLDAALARRTRIDYLAGRPAAEAWREAFRAAAAQLAARAASPDPAEWRYGSGPIRYPDQAPIPYRNRGTFIQVAELGPTTTLRTVAGPGAAEAGPHQNDQIPLVRSWSYKPLRFPAPEAEPAP